MIEGGDVDCNARNTAAATSPVQQPQYIEEEADYEAQLTVVAAL